MLKFMYFRQSVNFPNTHTWVVVWDFRSGREKEFLARLDCIERIKNTMRFKTDEKEYVALVF